MYTTYRGRGHTKKQRNNYKKKITALEREKRDQQKQIAELFPAWKQFLPCYSSQRDAVSVANKQQSITSRRDVV